MATYDELLSLFSDQSLHDRVTVACIVSAEKIGSKTAPFATPTVPQEEWALDVFTAPRDEGRKALMGVLAANKVASVATIQGASDATIQSNVDDIVPTLAGG